MSKTSNLPRCYICDSETVVHEEFRRCPVCGVIRTFYDYDSSIYRNTYADNYCGYANNGVNIPLQLFRVGLVSRWLKQWDSLLDVGCCIGEFIRFAEKYYSCFGYDPNSDAIRFARNRVNSVVSSKLLPSEKFKAVTMFDVIEHLEDPRILLKEICERLFPEGILAITTPTIDVFEKWEIDEIPKWKHYKPVEHLFLYSEDGLSRLLNQEGFKVIHVGREESDIRPGNSRGDILTCVARKEK